MEQYTPWYVEAKIRQAITRSREAAGLTHTALAAYVDVSPVTLAKYEKGLSTIPARLVWRIARVLRVSVADLYADIDDQQTGSGATASGSHR